MYAGESTITGVCYLLVRIL